MAKLFGTLLIVAAIIASFTIASTHPDMTDTRRWMTFWPEYLGVIALGGAGMLLWSREP